MPRLVCASCKIPMRVAKNGKTYIEETVDGTPVNIWQSDEYYCLTCGSSVLAGFGIKPIRTMLDDDFEEYLGLVEEDAIRGTA